MVHPGGAEAGVGAGLFESSAVDGFGVVGGSGVDVSAVFLFVVVDEVLVVVDVAFVDVGPGVDDDVVDFVRVAGVGVDVFVVRSRSGTFESGNGLRLCHLSGSSDGGMASPSIMKIPFAYVVFVSDFLLGVLAVFVEKVVHVLGKSRYPDRVVDVGGGDSLV